MHLYVDPWAACGLEVSICEWVKKERAQPEISKGRGWIVVLRQRRGDLNNFEVDLFEVDLLGLENESKKLSLKGSTHDFPQKELGSPLPNAPYGQLRPSRLKQIIYFI